MTERETPPSVTLKVYKQVKLTNETKKKTEYLTCLHIICNNNESERKYFT